MQYHWIKKQNKPKLLIFFTGWSFDDKPFDFLDSREFDVIMFYDYNDLSLPNVFEGYEEYYLVSWSMGVYTAFLNKDCLPKTKLKIAINGTPYPVHNDYGIPEKLFLLTLKHAKTGLEGKFYQNIFFKREEYEKYLLNPVRRSVENRENELKSLYENIRQNDLSYEKFYDLALVSKYDKIIPTQNQINFWRDNARYITLESGHFPYYNFKDWDEIINCNSIL